MFKFWATKARLANPPTSTLANKNQRKTIAESAEILSADEALLTAESNSVLDAVVSSMLTEGKAKSSDSVTQEAQVGKKSKVSLGAEIGNEVVTNAQSKHLVVEDIKEDPLSAFRAKADQGIFTDFFQLSNTAWLTSEQLQSHTLSLVPEAIMQQVLAKPIASIKRELGLELSLEISLLDPLLQKSMAAFYSLPWQAAGVYAWELGALQYFLYSTHAGLRYYRMNIPKSSLLEKSTGGLYFVVGNLLRCYLILSSKVCVSALTAETRRRRVASPIGKANTEQTTQFGWGQEFNLFLWSQQKQQEFVNQVAGFNFTSQQALHLLQQEKLFSLHWLLNQSNELKPSQLVKLENLITALIPATLRQLLNLLFPAWKADLVKALTKPQGENNLAQAFDYADQAALVYAKEHLAYDRLKPELERQQEHYLRQSSTLQQELLQSKRNLFPIEKYLTNTIAYYQLKQRVEPYLPVVDKADAFSLVKQEVDLQGKSNLGLSLDHFRLSRKDIFSQHKFLAVLQQQLVADLTAHYFAKFVQQQGWAELEYLTQLSHQQQQLVLRKEQEAREREVREQANQRQEVSLSELNLVGEAGVNVEQESACEVNDCKEAKAGNSAVFVDKVNDDIGAQDINDPTLADKQEQDQLDSPNSDSDPFASGCNPWFTGDFITSVNSSAKNSTTVNLATVNSTAKDLAVENKTEESSAENSAIDFISSAFEANSFTSTKDNSDFATSTDLNTEENDSESSNAGFADFSDPFGIKKLGEEDSSPIGYESKQTEESNRSSASDFAADTTSAFADNPFTTDFVLPSLMVAKTEGSTTEPLEQGLSALSEFAKTQQKGDKVAQDQEVGEQDSNPQVSNSAKSAELSKEQTCSLVEELEAKLTGQQNIIRNLRSLCGKFTPNLNLASLTIGLQELIDNQLKADLEVEVASLHKLNVLEAWLKANSKQVAPVTIGKEPVTEKSNFYFNSYATSNQNSTENSVAIENLNSEIKSKFPTKPVELSRLTRFSQLVSDLLPSSNTTAAQWLELCLETKEFAELEGREQINNLLQRFKLFSQLTKTKQEDPQRFADIVKQYLKAELEIAKQQELAQQILTEELKQEEQVEAKPTQDHGQRQEQINTAVTDPRDTQINKDEQLDQEAVQDMILDLNNPEVSQAYFQRLEQEFTAWVSSELENEEFEEELLFGDLDGKEDEKAGISDVFADKNVAEAGNLFDLGNKKAGISSVFADKNVAEAGNFFDLGNEKAGISSVFVDKNTVEGDIHLDSSSEKAGIISVFVDKNTVEENVQFDLSSEKAGISDVFTDKNTVEGINLFDLGDEKAGISSVFTDKNTAERSTILDLSNEKAEINCVFADKNTVEENSQLDLNSEKAGISDVFVDKNTFGENTQLDLSSEKAGISSVFVDKNSVEENVQFNLSSEKAGISSIFADKNSVEDNVKFDLSIEKAGISEVFVDNKAEINSIFADNNSQSESSVLQPPSLFELADSELDLDQDLDLDPNFEITEEIAQSFRASFMPSLTREEYEQQKSSRKIIYVPVPSSALSFTNADEQRREGLPSISQSTPTDLDLEHSQEQDLVHTLTQTYPKIQDLSSESNLDLNQDLGQDPDQDSLVTNTSTLESVPEKQEAVKYESSKQNANVDQQGIQELVDLESVLNTDLNSNPKAKPSTNVKVSKSKSAPKRAKKKITEQPAHDLFDLLF